MQWKVIFLLRQVFTILVLIIRFQTKMKTSTEVVIYCLLEFIWSIWKVEKKPLQLLFKKKLARNWIKNKSKKLN